MTHGSVLLTPRVFLNRDQPYSAIKPMTIGTAGGTVTQSFTVPFDVFCYGLQFSIYGQDLDGNPTCSAWCTWEVAQTPTTVA